MVRVVLALFVSTSFGRGSAVQISDQSATIESSDENQGLIQSNKLINIGSGSLHTHQAEQQAVDYAPYHCSWNYKDCQAGHGDCNIGGGDQPCAIPGQNRCWFETLNEAQIACNLHGTCTGIVRDGGGYEPRRGTSVYHHVAAKEMWKCVRNVQSKGGCMAAVSGAARVDEGYSGVAERGWYDVQGCGRCLDYCRWVGSLHPGTVSPFTTRDLGQSWWSCRLAGTTLAGTPKGYFSDWNYPKGVAEGSRPLQDVCQSGSFTADADKFFTIGVEGKFWMSGIRDSGLSRQRFHRRQNTPRMKIFLGMDSTTASAHWRFKKHGDKWAIVNRLTGLELSAMHDFGRQAPEGLWVATDTTPALLEIQCSVHKVLISAAPTGHYSNPNHWVRCDLNGCVNNAFLNFRERKTFRYHDKGCVAHWSCSQLGSGWTEHSRQSYVFCTAYTCKKEVEHQNQKLRQHWDVAEVVEFSKPDLEDPEPISVEEHVMDDISKELALVMDIGTTVGEELLGSIPLLGPIAGAIFSFGLAQQLDGPELADQLQGMADAITAQTARMISDGIAQQAVREVSNRLKARWNEFLLDYRATKYDFMAWSDNSTRTSQLNHLAHIWDNKADEFAVDMTTYFDDPSSNIFNVPLARQAFPFLKIAIAELFLMKREVILLMAYVHPDDACSSLVGRNLKPLGHSKATEYKEKLSAVQQALIAERLSAVQITYPDTFTIVMTDDGQHIFHAFTDRFSHPLTNAGNQDAFDEMMDNSNMANAVESAYKAALRWDMEKLSYSIHRQVAMLEKMEDDALVLCEKVRSDDEFRTRFEAN